MHIAGAVPDNAHVETFVAMSAILLGAAETATSELKDELKEVTIHLKNSLIVINSVGPKALLVVKASGSASVERVQKYLEGAVRRIKDNL